MKMAKKIDKILDKDALEYKYHQENKTMEQIAKEINVSVSTISRWIRHYQIKAKEHNVNQIIQDYVENNVTAQEIYKKYHISKTILKEILISNNIKIKTRSDFFKNLQDREFGELVVKELSRKEIGKVIWLCKCSCGNTIEVSSKHLLGNATKHCGSYVHTFGEKSKRWTGYKEISGVKWNNIKISAQNRNLEFSITIEYAWDLFLKQNRKCALTGLDLFMHVGDFKNRLVHGNASLDRIDPTKGYTEDNIQWTLWDVNKMKQDLSQDKFLDLCEKITIFKKEKI